MYVKRRKDWRMSCDVGEVTEKVGKWALHHFPSLHLRNNSFSSSSVALPTSQFILQPSFRFSYVTSSSLNSPGEPPMESLGVYQKAVYFYCCVVNVSFVKFTDLILWYMNLMNNGQMDRGNENPTQHFPWWLRKTTKKPQSGWSAPGFEPGTSRMRVSCVSTEPPRSVMLILFLKWNYFRFLKIEWLLFLLAFALHTYCIKIRFCYWKQCSFVTVVDTSNLKLILMK